MLSKVDLFAFTILSIFSCGELKYAILSGAGSDSGMVLRRGGGGRENPKSVIEREETRRSGSRHPKRWDRDSGW
jgi:hypothetical protein